MSNMLPVFTMHYHPDRVLANSGHAGDICLFVSSAGVQIQNLLGDFVSDFMEAMLFSITVAFFGNTVVNVVSLNTTEEVRWMVASFSVAVVVYAIFLREFYAIDEFECSPTCPDLFVIPDRQSVSVRAPTIRPIQAWIGIPRKRCVILEFTNGLYQILVAGGVWDEWWRHSLCDCLTYTADRGLALYVVLAQGLFSPAFANTVPKSTVCLSLPPNVVETANRKPAEGLSGKIRELYCRIKLHLRAPFKRTMLEPLPFARGGSSYCNAT